MYDGDNPNLDELLVFARCLCERGELQHYTLAMSKLRILVPVKRVIDYAVSPLRSYCSVVAITTLTPTYQTTSSTELTTNKQHRSNHESGRTRQAWKRPA